MISRRLLLPGPLTLRLVLWLALFVLESLLLCPVSGTVAALSFKLEVLGRTTVGTAWGGNARTATSLGRTDRTLLYLEKAEAKEIDPWLRDDIRIAWITTLYASRGDLQAHTDATYRVLGCHPHQVWPRLEARRRAALGASYDKFFGGVSSRKKPVRAVTLAECEQRNRAA